MRPLRLHLDDFGSFRRPATIDFTDVDYFALVGPTGAGKSTVIDAICFALYGTVPRWDKENVIAHALAPTATAGKVALVFEAAGRRYAVVRALRRGAKGRVQTKEARIEELDPAVPATADLAELMRNPVRLIADGDRVTPAVERITGLKYRFFTQCVVLPQGKFAEFLHARPADRQDLLVRLLDAGVYERIRIRADQEARAARQAADLARGQAERLADADEAAEQAAADRLAAVRELAAGLKAELDALRAHDAAVQEARTARKATAERLAALDRLAMPAEVPSLAERARRATAEAARLTEEADRREEAARAAREARAGLGDKAALTAELALFDAHAPLSAELARAEAAAGAAEQEAARCAAEAEQAAAAHAAAERERDRLRDAHVAADLARRLVVGHPCPTCLRPVTELPRHPELADLAAAEERLAAAARQAEAARDRHRKAELAAAREGQKAAELKERLAEITLPPDRAALEAALERIAAADAALAQAEQARDKARAELAAARRRAEAADRETRQAHRDLAAARDTVVALGAPPLDGEDLHQAWTALLAWRDQAAAAHRETAAAQERELARLEQERAAVHRRILQRLGDQGIPLRREAGPDEITAAVAEEAARAEHRLAWIRERRAQARRLARQAAEKEQEAQVAHALAQHLRADAFERWLCTEALELLVAAASDILRDLSDKRYELVLNDKSEIEVVDYAEAGMRRNVRTLSGGETFQAALALALALSGEVARLAGAAAHSLDSIFLDEGFGTLDPVTLDAVATTLERLAADGERMVGVVTHVPALAERVPVRFEVTRDVTGSHIRRAVAL